MISEKEGFFFTPVAFFSLLSMKLLFYGKGIVFSREYILVAYSTGFLSELDLFSTFRNVWKVLPGAEKHFLSRKLSTSNPNSPT